MKKFICTLLFLATSWVTGWAADKLPSLCDEWNIVVPPFTATDPFHTFTQYLESDTIISGKSYVKLLQEDIYKGALREESNATIYYIPSGSTHDYLLYAFNAKEGDVLDNIWTGGNEDDFPNGKSAVVQSITQTTPRQFVLSSTDEKSENTLFFRWIEGIGMEGGAVGQDFPLGMPIDPSPELLCAYKNGNQVYASPLAKIYGCHIEGFNPPIIEALYPINASSPSVVKTLHDGHILILRGDKTYTLTGQEVNYNLQR